MQAVELDFTLAQQGRLVLATTTGAQSEAVRDFCYWSEVRLLDMSTGAPPKKP